MAETNNAILYTIITIFVLLGAVLPFVHAEFDQAQTELNTQGLADRTGQEYSESTIVILSVITSIFTMFFWTFGNIPAIIDLVIFIPMRLTLLAILYDKIRGI